LYPSRTIEIACTVSRNIMSRYPVMICFALKALKCLSHSAEEAVMTSTLRAISDSRGYCTCCSPHHLRGSNIDHLMTSAKSRLNYCPARCELIFVTAVLYCWAKYMMMMNPTTASQSCSFTDKLQKGVNRVQRRHRAFL